MSVSRRWHDSCTILLDKNCHLSKNKTYDRKRILQGGVFDIPKEKRR
jgi:hypothetical protein